MDINELKKSESQEQQGESAEQPIPQSQENFNDTSQSINMKESLQLQKSLWIKEQIEARRKQEDKLLEQIAKEQLLFQEIDENMNANMEHSKEGRAYREEIQSRMERQIYEMHDLGQDKLEGIREYGNAYHRGFSLAMFILSVALTVFAGYLNGFGTQITITMLALTAVQSAVLVHNERGIFLWKMFCKLVSLLLFPVMLVLFLCYELQYPVYDIMSVYSVYAILVLVTLFTLVYFAYDPYRAAKSRIGDAKGTLRSLEKQAKRQVKRSEKVRIKEESKQGKLRQKEEVRLEKLQKREEEKIDRLRRKEQERETRAAQRLETRMEQAGKMEGVKERMLGILKRDRRKMQDSTEMQNSTENQDNTETQDSTEIQAGTETQDSTVMQAGTETHDPAQIDNPPAV